ncbi:MAG: methylated-DNA--[protein]-cysteine S-methyltransferase [Parvibaculaceae bacterium]|nr:methylated-DNA--[protein]-cysteine S-methyltransferase [Parvibaculaceae bacterium]
MPRIDLTPEMATTVLATPLGDMPMVAGEAGLKAVMFPIENIRLNPQKGTAAAARHLDAAVAALSEYFAGRRTGFADLRLDADGTAFQRRVWAALRDVPFGATRSYRDVAGVIGNPKGMRAVGLANARNPIPVIVPCHRVIGANGALTGFGGGLDAKRWLLEFEGVRVAPPSAPAGIQASLSI